MKVALPYWQDRISPVLDTADNFIIADIRTGKPTDFEIFNLSGKSYSERAKFLKTRGAAALLCGAASDYCLGIFRSGGIDVIPWLRGKIDCVLEAYKNSGLQEATFIMPGRCGQRKRRRAGKGKRKI